MRSIEAERPVSPEDEKAEVFDAVLVHGWWISQGAGEVKDSGVKGEEGWSESIERHRMQTSFIGRYFPGLLPKESMAQVVPGLRARFSDHAAQLLFHGSSDGRVKGGSIRAKHIVLTCGKIWGPNYPSVAQLMRDQLVENYGIPSNRVIVRDGTNPLTTEEEVDAFLDEADKQGWTKVADLAFRIHNLYTIPRIYQARAERIGEFENFKRLTVEEVIEKMGDERVKELMREFSGSIHEKSYRVYEEIRRALYRVGGEDLLKRLAGKQRNKKTAAFPLIDDYDL